MTAWAEHKGPKGPAAYRNEKNQRSVDGLAYLREVAEIAVLGFVGLLNAVVNTRAVARYLGGNVVLSNLPGPTMGIASRRCAAASVIPTDLTLYRAGSRRRWRLRLEPCGT